MNTDKQDVYARITNKIATDLEKGVRPRLKPLNAAHTQGARIPKAPQAMSRRATRTVVLDLVILTARNWLLNA